MERKQAIILLLLVLAVSLVSFSLGVMVGRGGAPDKVAQSGPQPVPPRPVALTPATPALPSAEQTASSSPAPNDSVPAAEEPAENLSFYETLPRGDLPLGSGINLPPATSATQPAAAGESEPVKAVRPEMASQPTPQSAATKRSVVETPAPIATGSYVVQLASFKDSTAARKLQKKLDAKGYRLFVEAADLGNKGVWHRVFAGPFADRTTADQVAGQLQQKEKIKPLVRKR